MAGSATDPPSLVPLKALRYGCRVLRGPDWQYYDDSELTKGMGTVVEPDDSILTEWTLTGCNGNCGGRYNPALGMHTGGWWVDRSCAVMWDGDEEGIHYYRAGDDGCFDLLEVVGTGPPDVVSYHNVLTVLARARAVIHRLQNDPLTESVHMVPDMARFGIVDVNLKLLCGLFILGNLLESSSGSQEEDQQSGK